MPDEAEAQVLSKPEWGMALMLSALTIPIGLVVAFWTELFLWSPWWYLWLPGALSFGTLVGQVHTRAQASSA